MIIKNSGTVKTTLSPFDLLGKNEVALSKAFAFLLGAERDCYFEFLRFLGLRVKNSERHYHTASILIERSRDEGRTDIELSNGLEYEVIVECKVGGNRLKNQRSQYLTCFSALAKRKVLCFITQERDTNKQIADDITIINTSWLEVIELFNSKKFTDKPTVAAFLNFATKNYKMKELKEVLIQDVNNAEIERFEKFRVYRRNQTFGTPLYFAPYYTHGTNGPEGISSLARVLGILTLRPNDIDNSVSDLEAFSSNETQIKNWILGVKHGQHASTTLYTYYFLDEPLAFRSPLRKDGGVEKGRGKNWIAGYIPPNRCVRFTDFIKHIPELMP